MPHKANKPLRLWLRPGLLALALALAMALTLAWSLGHRIDFALHFCLMCAKNANFRASPALVDAAGVCVCEKSSV